MGYDITVSGYGQLGPYGGALGVGTEGVSGQVYMDGNAVVTAEPAMRRLP